MPSSDKKMLKKRKLRQKQKQKQVVRTNVKVNVQSSGGSGGGGSSQGGMVPSYIPSAFNEQKLASLVEQIAAKVPVRQSIPVPVGMPIQQTVEPPISNSANDNATLKGVFNSPINFDEPLVVGGVSHPSLKEAMVSNLQEAVAAQREFVTAKRRGRKPGSKNKPKEVQEPISNDSLDEGYIRTYED